MRSYRFVSGDPLESHTVLPQNSRSADGHTVGLAAQQDTRMSLLEEVTGLQREWTDRFVQVDGSIPELKRFAGLTGQVKTVNMSGHALVEFVGSEDIGWYDIHPQFLTVVEADVPTESTDDTQAAAEDAPAPAQEETTAPAEEAAPVDTSNLSPLELARLQDSGGAAAAPAKEAAAPTEEAAPAEKAPAVDTSNLSPLELARLQDSGGSAPATTEEETTATDDAAVDEPEEVASDNSPASNVDIPEAEGPERTAAILAACRAQDGG